MNNLEAQVCCANCGRKHYFRLLLDHGVVLPATVTFKCDCGQPITVTVGVGEQ